MSTSQSTGPFVGFRIALSTFSATRTDGVAEDDFKTFAQATILTRGRPNSNLWYTADTDIQFAKTSVRHYTPSLQRGGALTCRRRLLRPGNERV